MNLRPDSVMAVPALLSLIALLSQMGLLIESQKVPAIFMFGDSYGDTGNNDFIATFIKANFPPYGRDFKDHIATGRISNGKLMSDYFAEGLGVKEFLPPYLDPNLQPMDLVTGVCFASSGSGLDNLTAHLLDVIPFWKQIDYFKEYSSKIAGLVGEEEAKAILKDAIYFITIGTNDFSANYFLVPIRHLQFTVAQYTDFLLDTYTNYIKELFNLGARKIAVINVPPLGCLPIERTLNILVSKGECAERINWAASGFNSRLNDSIPELKSALPGLGMISLDYNNLVSEYILNPNTYGFEEVAKGCCGTGTYETAFLCNKFTPCTCPDASTHLFFDSLHLSQKAYQMISNVFLTNDIPQLL